MSDLRGLIERCEKAVGPDRELDAQIYIWVHGLRANAPVLWTQVAPYTNSLDAALALVEKMRPGYRWGVSSVAIKIGAYPDGKTAYGEGFRAHVTKNSPLRPMPSTADAPTPALAIILALLRSLLNTTEGGEAE